MQSLCCVRLFTMHKQRMNINKSLWKMPKTLLQIPGIVLL